MGRRQRTRRKDGGKTDGFRAPRDPDERAALRAKADKRWPHPRGTHVYVSRPRRKGQAGWSERPAVTRSGSFYNKNGHVVVFLEGQSEPERVCRLAVRELPAQEPHWSDR